MFYCCSAKPNFYDHESPHYCSEGVYQARDSTYRQKEYFLRKTIKILFQFALFIVIIAYAFMIFTVFAFCWYI